MGCGPKGTRGPFTVLDAQSYATTLVAKLTPCVDKLRDLNTKLGARPYQIALVRTRWTGGERGEGAEELVSREVLVPTPEIKNLAAVQRELQAVGQNEGGVVRVTEISPTYGEDFLLGLGCGGTPIPPNEQFYWEITLISQDRTPLRRRFFPRAAPQLDATNFQWSVDLLRSNQDRARNGDPDG